MKKKLLLNLAIFTLIFCFNGSAQNLEVDGIGKFNLNGGSIELSTPGGWQGIIAHESSGQHRRDIIFRPEGIGLTVSNSSSPPANNDGMWIVEGGNTGIGTSSPDGKLDIDFGSTGSVVGGTPGGNGPGWIFYNAQGERWDMFASNSSFLIGRDDASFDVEILESGSLNLNNTNGAANGELHVKQEGVAVGSNGMVHQHPSNGNRWNTLIDNANDYNFAFNGTLKAYIKDTDGGYVTVSDRRLKSEIKAVSNIMPSIHKLRPVTYKFNSHRNAQNRSWGFIAQEVEEIFPDFVTEKDGYKGIAYDNFAVLAIKAIQEQQVEIENLKKRIEQLETP